MGFTKNTCEEFVEVLASKAPVPGGGGASALVGAVGMALGNMVGSLTVGKKKYADVEADIIALKEKATALQADFLRLVEKDAEVFEPLAKAYGMPRETEEEKAEKARVMAIVLKDACSVPMEIMEKCCEAIDVIEEFAAKGSALAISDAGVGVAFCKGALLGASLNVFINTKSMADKEYAAELNAKADKMIEDYSKKADAIFDAVKTHVNMPSEKRVLTFQGFDIVVPARMHPKQMTEEERKEGEGLQGIPYIFVKRHGAHYMEIHSNSGITRALNNLLEGLPDKLKHQEDVLETLKQRLHDVELDLQTPGETYAAEMQTLKERIEQINEELGLVA